MFLRRELVIEKRCGFCLLVLAQEHGIVMYVTQVEYEKHSEN